MTTYLILTFLIYIGGEGKEKIENILTKSNYFILYFLIVYLYLQVIFSPNVKNLKFEDELQHNTKLYPKYSFWGISLLQKGTITISK